MIRLSYDHAARAAYLSFADVGPGEDARQEVTKTGLILHFDRGGRLIGIESLNPTAHFLPDLLTLAERSGEGHAPY